MVNKILMIAAVTCYLSAALILTAYGIALYCYG